MKPEDVKHPDESWAKRFFIKKKPDCTYEEIESLYWYPLAECYMVVYKNIWLGIEKDGHIHS